MDLKTMPSRKPFLSAVSLAVSAVVIFVIGGGFLMFKLTENKPPVFNIRGDQAFIGADGFLSFEDEDFKEFEGKEISYTSPSGVRMFYSKNDMSVNEIIQSIKPQAGLRFNFSYYNNQFQKFVVYPTGSARNAIYLDETTINSHVLPKYTAFYLTASQEFSVSGLEPFFTEIEEEIDIDLNSLKAGWYLFIHDDFEKFRKNCNNRIGEFFASDAKMGAKKSGNSGSQRITSHVVDLETERVTGQIFEVEKLEEFFTKLDKKKDLKPLVGNAIWVMLVGPEKSCK